MFITAVKTGQLDQKKLMKPMHNNSKLLIEFQAGNEQAFDQVFNRYYPALSAYANRLLPKQDIGQDIAQESFITAWNRKADFQSIAKVKSFLYTCVRNSCFNQLEKAKVKDKYTSSFSPNELFDDQNILTDIIHAEVVSSIFSQVDTLPQQCRKVIYMTFKDDKKPKEIAKELGLTISTINNQKMRGLILLRGRLPTNEYLIILLALVEGILK